MADDGSADALAEADAAMERMLSKQGDDAPVAVAAAPAAEEHGAPAQATGGADNAVQAADAAVERLEQRSRSGSATDSTVADTAVQEADAALERMLGKAPAPEGDDELSANAAASVQQEEAPAEEAPEAQSPPQKRWSSQ
eukprot:2317828-Prymnesium_polylepis.1